LRGGPAQPIPVAASVRFTVGASAAAYAVRLRAAWEGHRLRCFARFRAFYPLYLREHRHPLSRRLQFVGSAAVLLAICSGTAALALGAAAGRLRLRLGGHGFFEKRRPAIFRHRL
jgi:hypothetical protein